VSSVPSPSATSRRNSWRAASFPSSGRSSYSSSARPAEGAGNAADRAVPVEREDAAVAPFEQLGQRVFHQRQRAGLLGDVREHRGHERRLERDVDALRGARDGALELFGRERDHRLHARAKQVREPAVQEGSVVEVGPERRDHAEAAVRVFHGGLEALQEMRPHRFVLDEREDFFELVDHEDDLRAVGREQAEDGVMEAVLVAFELIHKTGRRVRRGAQQRGLQRLQRMRSREHVGDPPTVGAGDRAAPQRRDQSRSDDRGLAAAARSDDGEEPHRPQPLDELPDQLLASEEVGRVALLERTQPLVGVREDRAGVRRENGGPRSQRTAERHVVRSVVRLRSEPDHVHGVGEAFQVDGPSVHVGHAVDLPREVRDRGTREDLGRTGDPAQARGEVQCAAAVAAVDRDCLAGVQADADGEGQRRLGDGLIDEPLLELNRRSDRLAGGIEDGQDLVAAQLDDGAAAGLDALARHGRELAGQPRGGLVALLLREDGVAADVGDEERPDVRVIGVGAARRARVHLGHGGLSPSRSRGRTAAARGRARSGGVSEPLEAVQHEIERELELELVVAAAADDRALVVRDLAA
jgi:hypothetical protein